MSMLGIPNLLLELENKSPNLEKIKKYSETLQKSCIENETDSESFKSLGHCYLIQNNPQRAHECYQRALFLKGTEDLELWYGIGLMYYKNSNYPYAEPSFLKVLSADQPFCSKSSLHLKLGLIYKRLCMYSEALKHFSECSQEEKMMGLVQSGFCYIKLNSNTEALNSFKSAYEQLKCPYSALCLGWFTSFTDMKSGTGYLTEALYSCDKDTIEELDLLYALAQIQYKMKDLTEASNSYFKLLNKNSGDFIIWNSFGIMCAETGQSAQAFRCFIRASELSPNSAEVWNNIGVLYYRSGQINESKLAYEKALRMNSNADLIKEATKEFVEIEWNVSELPFIKRTEIIKEKYETKEIENKVTQGFVSANQVNNVIPSNYAAIMGYYNYFRQLAASRVVRQKSEDDKAAEILTDLAQLPLKRPKDPE